jgi:hypothetical protein
MQGAAAVSARYAFPRLRAATDGRSGRAAQRVIRHSAYAHTTSSSSCLARASSGPEGLACLTNQSSAKYS